MSGIEVQQSGAEPLQPKQAMPPSQAGTGSTSKKILKTWLDNTQSQ